MSTWFITGCSTGLGRALAEAVLAAGHRAVVTARDASTVADLAERFSSTATVASLDVTDTGQVTAVVRAAVEELGGLDVVVNNAGYGYRAAVEEADEADVAQLFATNFFGAVAVLKAVLPSMRERRTGTIINISSIGARITPAGSGYYAASKAALEGLSGSLRQEVASLGVRVVVVEPGGFRTDFAGRSLTQSADAIADYADTAGKRRKEHDRAHGTQPGDPAKAAAAIMAVAESAQPPAMLLLGEDALSGYRATATAAALAEDVEGWLVTTRSTEITD